MHQRYLLAKMTAKGLFISTGLGGGEVYISSSDVAAALGYGGTNTSRLSDKAYRYGRVKYCDDPGSVYKLRQILKAELKTNDERLVDVLITEGVWRPIHNTKKCQGRGCAGCSDGIVKRSCRERAATAGIAATTFRRNYNKTVDRILMKMDAWDSECLNHLYKQFAEQVA